MFSKVRLWKKVLTVEQGEKKKHKKSLSRSCNSKHFMQIDEISFINQGSMKRSVQFSCSVQLFGTHESQHARPPCPSPTPRVHSNSCPIESVMPSSHLILCCPLLLLPPIPPSIRVFPVSQLFAWGGQSTGVSALASFLPKKGFRVNLNTDQSLQIVGY